MTRVDQKKSTVTRSCRLLLILLLFGLLLTPERGEATENADQVKLPISIFVSIGAHLDFCREIGAGRVAVKLALPPGKNPATYAPAPQLIQALSRSRLYFKVGLPFETALLAKVKALPRSPEIIDAQKGIVLQPMQSDFPRHGGPHRHTGLDPHTWLDPERAKIIARHMRDGLRGIDPTHGEDYNRRYEALAADLDALDAELAKLLAPARGQSFLVFHPSWSYLAERYGLHQIPIEEEGKEPGPRRLVRLIEEARRRGVTSILVQRQFSARTAEAVAREIGAQVIPADPLAPDYFENLRAVAREIAAAARPL